MWAHQIVLQTPPRSSHPGALLSRQHPAPLNPFVATHTRPPSKCCKQTTYAIPNSFRCNTYKKQGVGVFRSPNGSLPSRRSDASPASRTQLRDVKTFGRSDAPFASRMLLRDDFSPRVFNRLHTLPSYVSRKSFACHSYENCRVYTKDSHSETDPAKEVLH